MGAVVIIQSSAQPSRGDAALAGILAEQGQSHLAQPGQVFRGVALPGTAAVLLEEHIQAPVLAILDTPVTTHTFGKPRRAARAAAEVVSYLIRLLGPLPTCADYLHQRPQIGPFVLGAQAGWLVQHRADTLLRAAVADLPAGEG